MHDRRLAFLLLGTVVTLGMAWALKGQCVGANWDGFQYRELCYNDIQPLYHARSLDADAPPYVGAPGLNPDGTPRGFIEYPVLTGLLMYLAALLVDDGNAFMVWNAVFLSVAAMGTTATLYAMVGDKRQVALWAAAPPLILYAFHNWDLLAVLLGTLGLFFYTRARFVESGLLCALGASAKVYPLFFLPLLGIAILARDRRLGPDGWRFGLGAVGGLVLANAPFMAANFDIWLQTYTFHAKRVPNFETVWYAAGHYGNQLGWSWLADLGVSRWLQGGLVLVALGLIVALGVGVWRGSIPPLAAAFGAMLVFMLFNKIYSVQYTLWAIPFFVLLQIPLRKFVALLAADLVVYISIFTFFLHWNDGRFNEFYNFVAIGVVARTLALAWLLAGTFRPSNPRPSPAAE
jgi:hypothetical protein